MGGTGVVVVDHDGAMVDESGVREWWRVADHGSAHGGRLTHFAKLDLAGPMTAIA